MENWLNIIRYKRNENQNHMKGGGQGKVAQIMYTHVSKCKNNKLKILKRY
jgi:hypothetical protein